jgi:hypothetical protein
VIGYQGEVIFGSSAALEDPLEALFLSFPGCFALGFALESFKHGDLLCAAIGCQPAQGLIWR